jgi:hypothetical protein
MGGLMADEVAMKSDLNALKAELLDRMEALETRLLTEFHKYAQAAESRTLVHEVTSHTLLQRMAAVETRVRELEKKAADL